MMGQYATSQAVTHFKLFSGAVHDRLNEFKNIYPLLFRVDCGDLFSAYLSAFPAGTDPIFRTQSEHNCRCCGSFIKNLGPMVGIDEGGQIVTLWGGHANLPYPYNVVAEKLDSIVKSSQIEGVFRSEEGSYGKQSNVDAHDTTIRWNHFWGNAPSRRYRQGLNDTAQVLKRALDEFRLSDFDIVLDLIDSNNLYKGSEFRHSIDSFRRLLLAKNGPNYHWQHCDSTVASFRNTSIGTLFIDLAAGMDLTQAVTRYEKKVAPGNYKRSSSVITSGMINLAMEKISELGLTDSLQRRYAKIEDISVADVLFVDNKVRGQMKGGIADLLMAEAKPKKVDKSKAIPISIEDFIKKPFSSVSVILGPENMSNFVTLTAPVYPDSPSLFKWSNGFGWSYDGNVADSIKERVKKAGGNVTNAALRCSLAWFNKDDLDIHAYTPDGLHIWFSDKRGVLDVDANAGSLNAIENAVENLSWTRLAKDGVYKIVVDNYNNRGDKSKSGCEIEVEYGGKIRLFTHKAAVGGNVHMLDIIVEKGKVVDVKAARAVEGESEVEKWGVTSGRAVPVTTILRSPNHWENEAGIGALHWFFMLDGCKSPEPSRGMYNEFLRPDLEPHRKVFEVLGSKTKCDGPDQLAGVGFTHSRNDSVTVIADHRTYEVNF